MKFDFARHRVRIGPIWNYVANVHGGEELSRVSTVNTMERDQMGIGTLFQTLT